MKRILSLIIAGVAVGALAAFMAYPAMAAAPEAQTEKVLVTLDVKLNGKTATFAMPTTKGIGVLKAKVLLTTAALAAQANGGNGNEPAPAAKYCLNNDTVVPPVTLYAAQGSRDMTSGVADTAIDLSGGYFFLGWNEFLDRLVFLFSSSKDDANELLLPGWSGPYVVSAGACAPGKYTPIPRKYLGCGYPAQVDPTEQYSGAPYGVAEQLSKTNMMNGWWLTCQLPAGYKVLEGAIVSTGMGGPVYDSTGTIKGAEKATPQFVASALAGEPLGWAKIIVKS